jgi:hypothetical protein
VTRDAGAAPLPHQRTRRSCEAGPRRPGLNPAAAETEALAEQALALAAGRGSGVAGTARLAAGTGRHERVVHDTRRHERLFHDIAGGRERLSRPGSAAAIPPVTNAPAAMAAATEPIFFSMDSPRIRQLPKAAPTAFPRLGGKNVLTATGRSSRFTDRVGCANP